MTIYSENILTLQHLIIYLILHINPIFSNEMFTLSTIKFYEGCKYLKNLKPGIEYKIRHHIAKDFFAPNICLSAVVGKNGAGKSSLLDMIFRIVNNLSYCFFNHIEREASAPLKYIKGIYADLYYQVDDNTGVIRINDLSLDFQFNQICYSFEKGELKTPNNRPIPTFTMQKEFAKNFFYTIATNYSLQSFIANDYVGEETIPITFNRTKSWINSLFHKNDGYLCPIVLNPYRDNGLIDMENKGHLTTSRLAALLIEEDPEYSLLDDYTFYKLESNWQPRRLQERFTSILDGKTKLYPSEEEVNEYNQEIYDESKKLHYEEGKDLRDFKDIAQQKNSFAYIILETLGCPVNPNMSDIQLYIRMYVVYKVLNIAEKYPSYHIYNKYAGNINYLWTTLTINSQEEYARKMICELTQKAKNDPSHIGLKLRQALNFIKNSIHIDEALWQNGMDYRQYAQLLGITPKGMDIEQRINWLPPGIFKYKLYLKNKKTGTIIPLEHLSSGERQFIYLTSTLLYHALNLKSVPSDGSRVCYNKLNFVLDEVELCFHPEYQRLFIKKLVDQITRIGLNKKFDINILITTHSPFILSDIPTQNILCMENGEIKNILKETFGANIYDILNNQFFMNKFVGDIAYDKIQEWIDIINNMNLESISSPIIVQELQDNINLIGDKFIRAKLRQLLKQKQDSLFSEIPLTTQIHILEKQLNTLKEKLGQK